MNTNELWDRFEAVMRRCSPNDVDAMRPPATEEQIAAAEKAMKVRFPAQLRAAYRRHDGVNREFAAGRYGSGLFGMRGRWCSLADMVANWEMKIQVMEAAKVDDHDFGSFPFPAPWWDNLAIRPEWWNKKWIPIGLSNTSTSYYVDLMPCARGTKGQIISDSGMIEAILIAPSLNAWIEFVTQSFESGRFTADPETGEWIDTVWGPHTRKSYSYYGWNSSGAAPHAYD